VVLLGIALGNWAYAGGKRSFKPLKIEGSKPAKFIAFLGKHSLMIYVLHQPAIIALLLLMP